MQPEISEFSYGFALTNELVGWTALRAAPIFPSLVEEGRAGGGYDVKLDAPGVPIYLQFKRSECMTRSSAKEIQDGAALSTPFHQFHLMDARKSDQHRLLLQLDNSTNAVFYAAPRFHTFAQINSAWNTNSITTSSIFVTPQTIGRLSSGSHTVAYDRTRAYCCSDPRPLEFLDGDGLRKKLEIRLKEEKLPLRSRLPAFIEAAQKAAARPQTAHREASDGERLKLQTDTDTPRTEMRTPRALPHPQSQLRELSDIAAKDFGSQLIIVQSAGGKKIGG